MSEPLDNVEPNKKRRRLDQTVSTTETKQKKAALTAGLVSNYRCVICWDTNNWNDRCYCCSNKHALCRICYHHLLADNRLHLGPSFCPICRSPLSYSETNAHPDIYNLSMEEGSVLPRPSGVYVYCSPSAKHNMGSVASTSSQCDPDVSQEIMVSLVRQTPTIGPDLEDDGDDDTYMAESNDYIFFTSNKLTVAGQDFILMFYVNGGNKTRQQILKNDETRSLWYQWIWLGSGIPFVQGKKKLHVSYNVTPCFERLGREVAGPPSHILQPIETEVAKHINYWQFEMHEGELVAEQEVDQEEEESEVVEQDEDEDDDGTYELLEEGEEIQGQDDPSTQSAPALNPTLSTAVVPPSSISSAGISTRSIPLVFPRLLSILRRSRSATGPMPVDNDINPATNTDAGNGPITVHVITFGHHTPLAEGLEVPLEVAIYSQQLRVSDCEDIEMPANQKGDGQVTPCHQLIQVSPDIVDALLAKGKFVVRIRMWMQKETTETEHEWTKKG